MLEILISLIQNLPGEQLLTKFLFFSRSCVGENVIYQWVEKIREESLNLNRPEPKKVEDNHEDSSANLTENLEESIKIENEKCPEIFHGEVIVDRKSSFQGHAAQVHSVDDVKYVRKKEKINTLIFLEFISLILMFYFFRLVMKTLLKNRKIENATHNIYAYRIFDENKKTYIHDCVDDGETQAGGRLLHFLQIVDINNLIVVVSRWYGGIHLGPDRFRHINNAARQVLESANFLSKNKRQ